METPHHIAVLRETGTALADTAEGNLDRPVPSCPDWNLADLVWHVGEVHHFWRSIASGEVEHPRDYAGPERPGDGVVLDWYRKGLEETVRVLSGLDTDAPRWTWAPQKDGAFIVRRMAQETLVHAWDAQYSAGAVDELPAGAAVDGVSEFLEFFLPLGGDLPGGFEDTVCLRATDLGDSWTVDRAGDAWRVRHTEAEGVTATVEEATVTVEGTASELLLTLWRRTDASQLTVTGDGEAFARLLTVGETE